MGAESRRQWSREFMALPLEEVLRVVVVAWRNRRRRPTDWVLVVNSVNLVRHNQHDAWLHRQLEGAGGKEGA